MARVSAAVGVLCSLGYWGWDTPDEEAAFGENMKLVQGGEENYLAIKRDAVAEVWDPSLGQYNFGRYLRPPQKGSTHLLTAAQMYSQHKEWHWSGFSNEEMIVGVAVLQFGYASHAIMYYHNLTSGSSDKKQYEVLLLGRALGATFLDEKENPSTLTNGCSNWTSGATITQCYSSDDNTLQISAEGPLASGSNINLKMTFDLADDDSLSFIYPLGKRRPAIVSKLAGLSAKASLSIDGVENQHMTGLGMVDWTRSIAARFTKWNWAAFNFRASSGERIGIQLSSGVYEDSKKNGVESCLFIDGKLTALDSLITFQKPQPENFLTQRWNVSSSDGVISYTFTPRDRVYGSFHLYVLEGDLHHFWGTVSGTITTGSKVFHFSDVPSVIEEHYAIW
eukprot:TRINITY_DN2832_c3_g1_i2.p1 TRINITY_DN2832_c3_g1~~TRINITY_DN2832_c3_g1_i2.p1  ORF type:complete len:393 (+),score=77.98 TRINITY_DN2832_c3_g1_i2:46-1224(+)